MDVLVQENKSFTNSLSYLYIYLSNFYFEKLAYIILVHGIMMFFLSRQPGDATLAVGMIAGGSGLISFQHRRDPEASRLAAKEASAKANIRNTISDDYRTLSDDHVSVWVTCCMCLSSLLW